MTQRDNRLTFQPLRYSAYCCYPGCHAETSRAVFASGWLYGYRLCDIHANMDGFLAARQYWDGEHEVVP